MSERQTAIDPSTFAISSETRTPVPAPPKAKRGFAAMDPEKHREIAQLGGRTVHALGNGHKFTTDEARAAGTKGGRIVSQNREHMRTIGSKGGWICAQDPAHMAAIGRKGAAVRHSKVHSKLPSANDET
jgi:general stress protein YciG